MLNKVMLIGRLGRDPELRYAQGVPVTTLNIATDESYTDKSGNKVDKTEWHRVNVWGRQAENCSNYLAKGSLVYVEGSLQTRKYQDQQGQDRYATDIRAQRVQFLDRKGEGRPREDGYGGAFPDDESPRPAPHSGRNEQGGRPKSSGGRYRDDGAAAPSEAAMDVDDTPF